MARPSEEVRDLLGTDLSKAYWVVGTWEHPDFDSVIMVETTGKKYFTITVSRVHEEEVDFRRDA